MAKLIGRGRGKRIGAKYTLPHQEHVPIPEVGDMASSTHPHPHVQVIPGVIGVGRGRRSIVPPPMPKPTRQLDVPDEKKDTSEEEQQKYRKKKKLRKRKDLNKLHKSISKKDGESEPVFSSSDDDAREPRPKFKKSGKKIQSSEINRGAIKKIEVKEKTKYLFTVNRLLGKGSFGKVYHVTDALGNCYAMKATDDKIGYENESLQEVKIMKTLSALNCGEYNCIQMIKSYQVGTERYLQFPIYGPTIRQIIYPQFKFWGTNRAGFLLSQIKEILLQMISALDFLHSHGVFHTDIKSDNIIFLEGRHTRGKDAASNSYFIKMFNTQIRLIDFGLALYKPKGVIKQVCCKIYEPPESILKMPVSYPVDVWCVALVALAMYLGEEAFRLARPMEFLAQMETVLGRFPTRLINSAIDAALYFSDGRTRRPPCFRHQFLAKTRPLMKMKKTSSPETDRLFDLLQRMLQLDSEDRPTSKELVVLAQSL